MVGCFLGFQWFGEPRQSETFLPIKCCPCGSMHPLKKETHKKLCYNTSGKNKKFWSAYTRDSAEQYPGFLFLSGSIPVSYSYQREYPGFLLLLEGVSRFLIIWGSIPISYYYTREYPGFSLLLEGVSPFLIIRGSIPVSYYLREYPGFFFLLDGVSRFLIIMRGSIPVSCQEGRLSAGLRNRPARVCFRIWSLVRSFDSFCFSFATIRCVSVSYTHLTLPTKA